MCGTPSSRGQLAQEVEWALVLRTEDPPVTAYFDYNATAPVRPEVAAVVAEALALPLNPSSIHAYGQKARGLVERARATIAEAVSVFPKELTFTSSATEANNWALRAFPERRILVGADSHPSILRQPNHSPIPVLGSGVVDLQVLEKMLSPPPPSASRGEGAIVSLMLANNETGVIQPIAEVAKLAKQQGALLHVDAVQALGKIPVDFTALGCDMMTLTAHKCGGPVGAAALIIRQGLDVPPLLLGGGQELGKRAGTENVAAIVGFAKAVELFDFGHMRRLRGWLEVLENTVPCTVFGRDTARLPNTSCIALAGVTQEIALMKLDLAGFALSAGSACSSGRISESHVLKAMGTPPELSACAIRISGGWGTSEADVKALMGALFSILGHA